MQFAPQANAGDHIADPNRYGQHNTCSKNVDHEIRRIRHQKPTRYERQKNGAHAPVDPSVRKNSLQISINVECIHLAILFPNILRCMKQQPCLYILHIYLHLIIPVNHLQDCNNNLQSTQHRPRILQSTLMPQKIDS